jgi:hypothetical protein
MWKWVLIVLGIIVGVLIFAAIFITTLNPKGCVDFILMNVDEYNIAVAGEQHKVRISELGEGVTVEDRAYVVQKLILLTLLSSQDEAHKKASDEYGRALLEVADDQKLTKDEFERLKKMHRDLVSDEDVGNWLKKARELEGDENLDPDDFFD